MRIPHCFYHSGYRTLHPAITLPSSCIPTRRCNSLTFTGSHFLACTNVVATLALPHYGQPGVSRLAQTLARRQTPSSRGSKPGPPASVLISSTNQLTEANSAARSWQSGVSVSRV
eukprot:TRINITY_DN42440_c0_g1_i1.p2 TRINITY_DN42440_c0_g1~~TRINITY_DN42440_c0_g1_i1.p2  ORF type:complete len:123 (+),score=8.49 TRINITY_DN42440_c0_g1_i1:27-371(+)